MPRVVSAGAVSYTHLDVYKRQPLKPSGIRVGTPALTTRGMKEAEMRVIGNWIAKALDVRNDDAALERIRGEVAELANQFPLYAWKRAPVGVGV